MHAPFFLVYFIPSHKSQIISSQLTPISIINPKSFIPSIALKLEYHLRLTNSYYWLCIIDIQVIYYRFVSTRLYVFKRKHRSIKLYQYELYQYELVCYNFGSPRLTGITNLFGQNIVNKDGSVRFHKFINAIRDDQNMRCGDGLGHMVRPCIKHKKH